MRGLLGYRFLRWFAGDLKNRRKQPASIFDDQILESDVDLGIGLDCPDSEEDCVKQMSDSGDVQNEEEQNKRNENKIKNE